MVEKETRLILRWIKRICFTLPVRFVRSSVFNSPEKPTNSLLVPATVLHAHWTPSSRHAWHALLLKLNWQMVKENAICKPLCMFLVLFEHIFFYLWRLCQNIVLVGGSGPTSFCLVWRSPVVPAFTSTAAQTHANYQRLQTKKIQSNMIHQTEEFRLWGGGVRYAHQTFIFISKKHRNQSILKLQDISIKCTRPNVVSLNVSRYWRKPFSGIMCECFRFRHTVNECLFASIPMRYLCWLGDRISQKKTCFRNCHIFGLSPLCIDYETKENYPLVSLDIP